MVENQHRKITGYRDLTEEEIGAMNDCKALGAEIGDLIGEVEAMADTDKRCVAIARTEMQTGLMWLIRSIARPDGFG